MGGVASRRRLSRPSRQGARTIPTPPFADHRSRARGPSASSKVQPSAPQTHQPVCDAERVHAAVAHGRRVEGGPLVAEPVKHEFAPG